MCNCEYSNEHDEHAVAVLKDGEIVSRFTQPHTILLFFLHHIHNFVSYKLLHFFIFGHTTHESFMNLHQTVLQLPPLTYFSQLHSIVTVYVCLHSMCNYCTWRLCHTPQHLLETLRLFKMWAYTRCLIETNIQ